MTLSSHRSSGSQWGDQNRGAALTAVQASGGEAAELLPNGDASHEGSQAEMPNGGSRQSQGGEGRAKGEKGEREVGRKGGRRCPWTT